MKCGHCKTSTATLKDLAGNKFYCLSCGINVFGYPDWVAKTITLTEEEMEQS